jgi:two-component system, NarL family, response regulator YdfI
VIRVFIVAASSPATAGRPARPGPRGVAGQRDAAGLRDVAALPALVGLQDLVGTRDVEVVGSAPSFDSLAAQWPDLETDIVLVETSAEHFDAVMNSLAESRLASEAAVVILADHSEPRQIAEALRTGVRAVLPSELSADQLRAALEAAAAGLTVMHSAEVAAMFPAAQVASRALADLAEPLTPRESEVLQMLASGLANKEIAARLAISEHTAKFHVASILGKLGAGSRTEAVAIGIRRGLVLL